MNPGLSLYERLERELAITQALLDNQNEKIETYYRPKIETLEEQLEQVTEDLGDADRLYHSEHAAAVQYADMYVAERDKYNKLCEALQKIDRALR